MKRLDWAMAEVICLWLMIVAVIAGCSCEAQDKEYDQSDRG
ncbi:MAG: hypothetical protein K2P70_19930 [Hyphomonadaceae bacterium]|nr:hypothetical protein [Hyphomonadaceae bacterium]